MPIAPTLTQEHPIPNNITLRSATLDDATAMAQVLQAVYADQGRGDRRADAEDFITDFQEPGFDLAKSSRVAINAEGELIGFVIIWDNAKPPLTVWSSLAVLPAHYDTGLGEALMAWGVERAHQAVARCPDDARVALRAGSLAGYEPQEKMYRALGMTPIRYFFRMLLEMEEAPPQPQLPQGISIRAYRHPEELETMVRALLDGFRDHWGFFEEPFEDEVKHFQHHLNEDTHFDASVHFLAVDDETGAIAGLALCRDEEWSDPTVAYVKELAVLPDYRKRGVGLALLHHTFTEFWNRGQRRVALHVDGASLTGATRLYERAGMHIQERSTSFERQLRPGRDYTTTSVDGA
jgi:mycothiol synthase